MFLKNILNGFSIKKTPFWRAKHFMLAMTLLLAIVLVISLMKPAHAAVAYAGSTVGDNGSGSTIVTISNASTNSNQLLVAIVSLNGSSTITGPTGWVQINTQAFGSSARSSTFYRVQSFTGEPTTYDFTLSASVKSTAVMAAYSGVDLTNPVDVHSSTTVAAANTSMSAVSVTTTVPNTMLVAMYGKATATTFTADSSMTMRGQTSSSGGGPAGSKVTSGLQDILQASTGATGDKIMTTPATTGAATAHLVALRQAPTVSQTGYRWFTNSITAGTVGSPLASQDTAAIAPAAGQPFRLRMLLSVAEIQLPTTTAYKLQYNWQASGSCVSTGGYSDITVSTPIKYYDNAGVSDAATIVTNGSDPVRSGVTKVTQTYEELNNFTVATAIPVGQDGMWDFALTLDSTANPEGMYCLRVVNSNGLTLPTYSQIPGISSLTSASKIVQGSYRFSQNANSLTPGTPLAATNTSTTLGATNDSFRLRATAKGYQGFSQITSGSSHTCGIASNNLAYCWGSDANGRLGNGAITGDQVSPVAVDTSGVLSNKTILSIAAGYSHTCAIASDNQAYCWGYDTNGELGNGATAVDQVSPVAVDTSGVLSGKTILSISLGTFHTCAIASDNQAYCWGYDTNGVLGNGATAGDQVSPVAVDTSGVLSGKTILSITTGQYNTCAIASDNQAYCWGGDLTGQLGNGATTGDQVSPVAVDTSGVLSGKTILSISSGTSYTCAIASDNLAYCWGVDTNGRLGNGATAVDQVSPVAVDTSGVLSGKTIFSITTGYNNTCAIASDNLAYCWGSDTSGQLGNGATAGNQVSPVAVDTGGVLAIKTILSIIAGDSYTCAIASDNQAYCWGNDASGQLGNGATTGAQVSPVAVATTRVLSGKKIYAGNGSTCAIASDDQAYCWGSDLSGQLGNGATTGTQIHPVAVDTSGVLAGKTILSISTGSSPACAIASDNLAYCWGNDGNGQLGNGATTGNQVSPVAVDTSGVLSGKTILSISKGATHTCAIASDNLAYCWGTDGFGQLGNGATSTVQTSPAAVDTSGVLAGKTILSISTGSSSTCAIASDNQAYCWGSDTSGQLGNGATTGSQVSPVAVDASGVLSGKTILSITMGSSHTCAIASDNQAYCWGSDGTGQLGNGATTGSQVSPVAVDTSGVLSGKTILSITMGSSHTCAIASDNLSYCWGNDGYGELGNGATTGTQASPVAVDTSGVLSAKTILSISAGSNYTCAIASDNQVYCWGDDSDSQLGNGSTSGVQVSPDDVSLTISIIASYSIRTGSLSSVLQYAQKTLASCSVQTGYAAVTTSTPIAFSDNAGATSGAVIPLSDANDPFTLGGNIAQTYHDLVDSITNISDLNGESFGLWDFSLRDNGAPAATTYCLRLASNNGTAFGSYESYPEITTASGGAFIDPQGGLLRGGQAVVNGIKNLFSW